MEKIRNGKGCKDHASSILPMLCSPLPWECSTWRFILNPKTCPITPIPSKFTQKFQKDYFCHLQ
jgi:hypothetical protein